MATFFSKGFSSFTTSDSTQVYFSEYLPRDEILDSLSKSKINCLLESRVRRYFNFCPTDATLLFIRPEGPLR